MTKPKKSTKPKTRPKTTRPKKPTKPKLKPKKTPKPRKLKPKCLNCNSKENLIYSGEHIRDDKEVVLYACKNCELEKIKTPIKCIMCDGYLMWVPKAREMFCSYTSCFYTRVFGVKHQCSNPK